MSMKEIEECSDPVDCRLALVSGSRIPERRKNAMRLMPYIFSWAALAVVVIVLAVRRWLLGRQMDETLHLGAGETRLVAQQVAVDKSIRTVDRWGEWLTVVVVLYGLTIVGFYVYSVWAAGAKPVL
jgi:hypothetical protein